MWFLIHTSSAQVRLSCQTKIKVELLQFMKGCFYNTLTFVTEKIYQCHTWKLNQLASHFPPSSSYRMPKLDHSFEKTQVALSSLSTSYTGQNALNGWNVIIYLQTHMCVHNSTFHKMWNIQRQQILKLLAKRSKKLNLLCDVADQCHLCMYACVDVLLIRLQQSQK